MSQSSSLDLSSHTEDYQFFSQDSDNSEDYFTVTDTYEDFDADLSFSNESLDIELNELSQEFTLEDEAYSVIPEEAEKWKRNYFKKGAWSHLGQIENSNGDGEAGRIRRTIAQTKDLMQTEEGRLLQANTMVYGSNSIPDLANVVARAVEAANEFGHDFDNRVLDYSDGNSLEAMEHLIHEVDGCNTQNTVLISATGSDAKAVGGSWRDPKKAGPHNARYRKTPMGALMDPKQNPYLKERLMSRAENVHHHHIPYYGAVALRGVPLLDSNDWEDRNFIEMAPVDLTLKTNERAPLDGDDDEAIKEAACLKLRMALLAAMREGYANVVLDLESFNKMGCSTELMGDVILKVLIEDEDEIFKRAFHHITFSGLERNPDDEHETKLFVTF